MKVDAVADVGNSRIKWGRCPGAAVTENVSLPPDDAAAWQEQRRRWHATGGLTWAVAGVHPARRDRLADWLRAEGDRVVVLAAWQQLPLRVALEQPERVGIDRLLNAVAANTRRSPGVPAVLIDAGSAVTVDWVDENGTFRGGAIVPGLRLMAQALHSYTALLPLVEVTQPRPLMPATSTHAAIEAGVFWAVVGGIQALVARLASDTGKTARPFLTGGDSNLLAPALGFESVLWPHMTLEGVRLTAETLP